MKIRAKLSHLRPNSAAPTLTESYEGQNQARLAPRKIAERATYSQSSYTTRPRRRSFDFTTTNKLRQSRGHTGEEPTISTIAASPTSLPPSSLPQKPRRHNHHHPPVPLADAELSRRSPQEGIRQQRRRHRPITDQGFPLEMLRWPDPREKGAAAKQRCLQEGQRRPQPPPSLVTAQGQDRVFTQAPTPPQPHIIPHRRRQAHQPQPSSELPIDEEEAPRFAAANRTSRRPPAANLQNEAPDPSTVVRTQSHRTQRKPPCPAARIRPSRPLRGNALICDRTMAAPRCRIPSWGIRLGSSASASGTGGWRRVVTSRLLWQR